MRPSSNAERGRGWRRRKYRLLPAAFRTQASWQISFTANNNTGNREVSFRVSGPQYGHSAHEIRPAVHRKFAVLHPMGATRNRKGKCTLPYCGPLTSLFVLLRCL